MADPIRWLALGYSVPVNPSKNRVYVWRKIKEGWADDFKCRRCLLPCADPRQKATANSNTFRQKLPKWGARLPLWR